VLIVALETPADQGKVYSLETYERVKVIEGHRGSVLGLCLSRDQELLFSSAGNRIVNVRRIILLLCHMLTSRIGLEYQKLRSRLFDLLPLRCWRYLLRLILLLPTNSLLRLPEYQHSGIS
jgi:hypothetical protein